MTHPSASYWNQGIDNVPVMTGASSLMDGADIREHAEKLGFELPFESVIDVGCGTGRLAAFTHLYYWGCDISEDAVSYCRSNGLNTTNKCVSVISGPDDIATPDGAIEYPIRWIVCLSVFTHIDRLERQAYLRVFATKFATNLLVDIIPGDGSGDVTLWTADWDGFQHDLKSAGWKMLAWYDRVAPTGPTHRYIRADRA
jgi:SAM-dependent methyltransferase